MVDKKILAIAIIIIIIIIGVAAYIYMSRPKVLTIRLWHWTFTSESERDLWNSLCSDFSEEYPQYRVEIAELSAGDLLAKTSAALEAGSPTALPDIVHIITPNLLWAKKGQLEDLSDVANYIINKYGNDLVDFWKEGTLDTIPGPDGVPRRYWLSNGYAIAGCLIVNLDLIEQANITLGDLDTFEEFNQSLYMMRDKFNQLGIEARPLDFQLSASAPNDGTADFLMVFHAVAGHPIYDSEGLHLEDEDLQYVKETIAILAKWYEDDILMEGALVEGEAENNVNFITNKCAMTGNAVASIIARLLEENPEARAAVIPFAGVASSVQSRPFMIPKDLPEERKEAAKTFLKWFFEKENYIRFYGYNGGRGALDAPIYKDLLNAEPYLSDPVWAGVKEILLQEIPDPKWISIGISMLSSEGAFMKAVSEYISGTKTLDEAANDVFQGVKRAVEEWGA